MNIYLASSFFGAGGRMKTARLAERIRKEFGDRVNLYVPQENGDINDKSDTTKIVTPTDISKGDNYFLKEADILIADLDGVEIDSGVSAEIGYVAGRNSITELTGGRITYIIGFITDIRLNSTSVEDLQALEKDTEEGALRRLDNLKYNHLYRNLYTIGTIQEWGEVIVSPDKYEELIVDAIDRIVNRR